ncbi:MAG: transcriptional regulator, partial [Verrucomicrobia bacterium]|nr:transcriptional regulator [Cytophagales bacterium]
LEELSHISKQNGNAESKEAQTFVDSIENIRRFASKADNTLEKIVKADEQWFFAALLKIL